MADEAKKVDTNLEFLPEDVCPELQTKTMFLNTEHRQSEFETRSETCTAHFWCQITMDVHGPDDDDVEPMGCRPGRSCYDSRDPQT